jgi:hypothetical protein
MTNEQERFPRREPAAYYSLPLVGTSCVPRKYKIDGMDGHGSGPAFRR